MRRVMRHAKSAVLGLLLVACGAGSERAPLPADPAKVTPPGQLGSPAGDCSGIRCDVPKCDGATTAIEGDVYDPAGKTKLYNVVAYVPNAELEPIAPTASCERCGKVSGDPIATALSDETGHFRIEGVPAGKDIPVVLQVGKWRAKITVPKVEACKTTTIDDKAAHLPGDRSQGDMPHIAVATGGFDELGCLLNRIGVNANEYSLPSDDGHVHVYRGESGGDYTLGGAPNATTLWNDEASLSKYDMVLLACEGQEFDGSDANGGNKSDAAKEAMHAYLAKGGRLFATHYHYVWFKSSPEEDFRDVASWNEPASAYGHETLSVDTSFPKGAALSQWLVSVGASKTAGALEVDNPAANVGAATPHVSQRWLYGEKGVSYMSFNTPIGVADDQQCGRAVLSDVHVSGEQGSKKVPGACGAAELTPQELALEFMLFDLSACVQSDTSIPSAPK